MEVYFAVWWLGIALLKIDEEEVQCNDFVLVYLSSIYT